MSKLPTVQVRFRAAPRALDAPARALLIGPLETTGTATADTPVRIVNGSDGAAFFGSSEMQDAIDLWFQSRASRDIELWAMGVDASTWTANTWEVTFTGTATASGTTVFRFGEYTVNLDIAKDDDQNAVATKFAAALTASIAPVAGVVDGVNLNQVNVTSAYLGAHTQRFPLSFDLYRDRGERGVAGVTAAIVNNADATGTPTFSSANLVEAYDYYLSPFRLTGWLDAVETWLDAGWEDRNNFAVHLVPLADTQANLVTFGDARQDKHTSYLPISNAPLFELSAAVAYLDAIARQQEGEGTANISGQRMPVPLLPAFTVALDGATLLDNGLTAIRAVRTTVTIVRAVVSYRENDQGAEDLVQFDLGIVLALAEYGNRLASYGESIQGKAIVADNTPLTPVTAKKAITENQVLGDVREINKQAWREAIIYAESEDAVSSVVTAITVTEDAGRKTGFQVDLDPELVRAVLFFGVLVQYR